MLSGNTVKYIQSLTHRKFRDKYHCFIAETPKVVSDLLTAGYNAVSVYATKEWAALGIANHHLNGVELIIVREDELKKISQLKTPREVVAVFRIPEPAKPNIKNKITVALDDIQDPGNLGTIIRIADWFGIENIVCSVHTANVFNPKVVQATMGSLAHVNVYYDDLIDFFKNNGIPVYATALEGKSVLNLKKIQEGIITIGNEGKGISEGILSLADYQISIPKRGKAESLNAAIATGIILSHVAL